MWGGWTVRSESKKRNRCGGCMSGGGEVKRKGGVREWWGKKKEKKWGVGVCGWWEKKKKKKKGRDIQREHKEREEENGKKNVFWELWKK